MPRKPRKPKQMKTALLQSEKHLLETGECCPDPKKHGIKDWRETGEGWVRPFTLVSPGGRDELQALWLRHKDSIMKDWKGPSKPWAQEEFEGGKDAT